MIRKIRVYPSIYLYNQNKKQDLSARSAELRGNVLAAKVPCVGGDPSIDSFFYSAFPSQVSKL